MHLTNSIVSIADSSQDANNERGIDATIEKITALDRMMEMGMRMSRDFAVDGNVPRAGKVLASTQVKGLIAGYHGE